MFFQQNIKNASGHGSYEMNFAFLEGSKNDCQLRRKLPYNVKLYSATY